MLATPLFIASTPPHIGKADRLVRSAPSIHLISAHPLPDPTGKQVACTYVLESAGSQIRSRVYHRTLSTVSACIPILRNLSSTKIHSRTTNQQATLEYSVGYMAMV
jgi:hypothetical protein